MQVGDVVRVRVGMLKGERGEVVQVDGTQVLVRVNGLRAWYSVRDVEVVG